MSLCRIEYGHLSPPRVPQRVHAHSVQVLVFCFTKGYNQPPHLPGEIHRAVTLKLFGGGGGGGDREEGERWRLLLERDWNLQPLDIEPNA